MGGDAGVASEPGHGSRFWFEARLELAQEERTGDTVFGNDLEAEPAESLRTLESRLRERHAGARILLTEDNAANLEVALEWLRAADLRIDVALTGEEAVQAARRDRYDLILMDVQLPGIDGLQATREIRAMPAHRDTPVLSMTANAFGEDRLACEQAGMQDHIVKPVDPELLYRTLLRWLPPGAMTATDAGTDTGGAGTRARTSERAGARPRRIGGGPLLRRPHRCLRARAQAIRADLPQRHRRAERPARRRCARRGTPPGALVEGRQRGDRRECAVGARRVVRTRRGRRHRRRRAGHRRAGAVARVGAGGGRDRRAAGHHAVERTRARPPTRRGWTANSTAWSRCSKRPTSRP